MAPSESIRPTAYIVHQTRNRVRFRIKEKRKDAEYFELLRRQLDPVSDDVGVTINAARGSVLFTHPDLPYSELVERLRQLGVFELDDGAEPHTHALTPMLAFVSWLDRWILSRTSGSIDLRTLVFIVALVAVIRQVRRGELFSPAWPILWGAVDMMTRHINSNDVDES